MLGLSRTRKIVEKGKCIKVNVERARDSVAPRSSIAAATTGAPTTATRSLQRRLTTTTYPLPDSTSSRPHEDVKANSLYFVMQQVSSLDDSVA
ncbi:unnamed protein product, partial [Brenthis ino]